MSERELSDIHDPFCFFDELGRATDRVLKLGESLVTNGEWESLPEYAEEIRKIVVAFERVVPLLEETHEKILAEQHRREQERLDEEECQRKEREERLQREQAYEQSIANFRAAYAIFQTKPNWSNTNAAIAAGEAVESNPLYAIDSRRNAIGSQLVTLRSKKDYLAQVREAARELLAEQAQAGEQS